MLVIFAGCEKNPIGALLYNGINQSTGYPDTWVLYRDGNLMASKNSFDFPTFTDYWHAPHQGELELAHAGESYTGSKSIYVAWNGDKSYDNNDGTEQDYVGFVINSENKEYGIDVSSGAYRYMKFRVKGHLNANVVLRVETQGADRYTMSGAPGAWESNAGANIVDGTWREYTITLVPSSLVALKDMFVIVLRNTISVQSNGGYVHIDDIRFTK